MNLFPKLQQRDAEQNPIRIGMIGAGKFGSMFLAQANRLPGIHIVGIADLNPSNARSNLAYVGWSAEKYAATSLDDAVKTGTSFVGDDWQALVSHPAIDMIIECTGDPVAAVHHVITAFQHGKNVINATVEADAFCGAGLNQAASEAKVIYSMAYGDQPALTCELVDWAQTCGFKVVAAGRGHKWLAEYRFSTPETIWNYWGLTAEQAERGRLNPKMFNSFLDGSKPAIESAAIANATGLGVPQNGLAFPPGSVDDIANLMRPKSVGGVLESEGLVEVISCLTPDGAEIPHDIRKGVWVAIEADNDYVRNCFEEYKVITDTTGRYMSLYKKWHLIGLELGMSVASVGLRGEPTGAATCFNADVPAIAKADLGAGSMLDGEGGFTIYGGVRPAAMSVSNRYLPLGLANHVKLVRPVKKDQPITLDDVEIETTSTAYKLREKTIAMLAL
ncbi:Gfo/Idh/MocA family oxidoreductase [Alphaproteobacteria bacterium]|nr:Gfo/Idh/MocA family oxidoreductase [Alphaproteobacteria bacterium]